MKFQVSTKPLSDGLNLGIINANVSKFYKKSCLAQVTATKNSLTINLEADSILSEVKLKGMGDEDTARTVMVDSLLLKQLVATFEANVTTFEFVEGGLILHSGKSNFTLPQAIEEGLAEFKKPSLPDYSAQVIDIDKSDWKFIKDNQMYAIAMSFVHPVYTCVWVGADNDVIVGDFDNSLFTHSKHGKLGTTCLLKDTIINLFNSLPDGAKLVKVDRSYIINVTTDGFEFTSQFTPKYEDDEDVGSYNSDIILGMMEVSEEGSVLVSTAAIRKFMSQAELLAKGTDATIKLTVKDNQLTLKDNNVDCKIDVDGTDIIEYTTEFNTTRLKSVISNYSDDNIHIRPLIQEDDDGTSEVAGIVVWSGHLTTVIAGVDD